MIKKLWQKTIIMLLCAGSLVTSTPAVCDASEVYADTLESGPVESDINPDFEQDLKTLEEGTEGEDYVANRVFTLCDNEEEAERIADNYSLATGKTFELNRYECGVAVLDILENPNLNEESEDDFDSEIKEKFDEIAENTDTVTATVSIAADEEFELPPVFPDYIYELASVEKPDTSLETFTDPFTKSVKEDNQYNESYQYYQEMVGAKLVWQEMDKLNAANVDPNDDVEYNGPLKTNFVNNLKNETVVVIDSGINDRHPDFVDASGNSVIAGKIDCAGAPTGYVDMNGHGSNVSGIIANCANSIGGRGIAAGVNIYSMNVVNDGDVITSAVTTAVNKAISLKTEDNHNICAINMSLGGDQYSVPLNNAIQNAVKSGITVLAAACNKDTNIYAYPASCDNVISVASVNSYYVKSEFSNYNDKVCISAPGGERATRIEEVGVTASEEKIWASGKDDSEDSEPYLGAKGTSQATPVVSAAVALLYAQNPDITPAKVRTIIENTAKPVYPSYQIGKGCVNIAAALGIDDKASNPTTDVESGGVENEFDVTVSLEDGTDISTYKGSIYYTLDGSDPDIREFKNTFKLDNSNPVIHFSYDSNKGNKENLKLLNIFLGGKSDIVSRQYIYNYTPPAEEVLKIKRCDETALDSILIDSDYVDSTKVSVMGTVSLKAVDSLTGKEVKVKWNSDDPVIASVDGKGNVKGNYSSSSPVKITATPTSGSLSETSVYLYVLPKAEELELYCDNTLTLTLGENYDLSDKWRIYPSAAMQAVSYRSSNTSFVTVSSQGIIKPVKTGNAVITVTASDGSKVSASLNIKCEVGADKIEIVNSSGRDFLCAGNTMKFTAVFNDGKAVPAKTSLEWDFTEASKISGIEYYATINKKTGAVTAKSNNEIYTKKTAEIVAVSPVYYKNGTTQHLSSESYKFDIYPRLESFELNKDYDSDFGYYSNSDRRFYFKSYRNIDLKTLVGRSPYRIANSYIFSSTDENVAYITSDSPDLDDLSFGTLHLRKPGRASVTVKANDGSNRSLTIQITVMNQVKIGDGSDYLIPNKPLQFKLYSDLDVLTPRGVTTWSLTAFYGKISDETFRMSDYININSNTGKITLDDEGAYYISEFLRKYDYSGKKGYNYLIVKAIYRPQGSSRLSYSATKKIQLYPVATTGVKVRDKAKDDGGIDISEVRLSGIGESKKIYPYSLPEASGTDADKRLGAINFGYSYTSSNVKVAKVDDNGLITAVSKGTAYITVKAGDSSGKTTKIKAVVDYPLVKTITLSEKTVYLRTKLDSGMTDPAGSKYLASADFSVASIAPAEAYKDVLVSSLNEKIAKVNIKEGSDPDDPVYTIIPVGKGSTRIKVTATDGSNKSAYVTVNVVKPNTNLKVSVKGGESRINPSKTVLLTTSSWGANIGNNNVKYYYYGIGTTEEEKQASIEEMKKYSNLGSSTGYLSAKRAALIGESERTIYVYAVANDAWHAVSDPIEIHINPGIIYINRFEVKTSNDLYDLASGCKVTMKATCNSNATDKGITWHIYDEDSENPGHPNTIEGSNYATINSSGMVTANKNLLAKHKVYIVTKAKKGGMVSAPMEITLYPSVKKLTVDSTPETKINRINVGDSVILKVSSESNGLESTLNKYYVTYSTGSARVYLEENPDTNQYDGSYVKVVGQKKGSTRVKFKICDASNKQIEYVVYIQ